MMISFCCERRMVVLRLLLARGRTLVGMVVVGAMTLATGYSQAQPSAVMKDALFFDSSPDAPLPPNSTNLVKLSQDRSLFVSVFTNGCALYPTQAKLVLPWQAISKRPGEPADLNPLLDQPSCFGVFHLLDWGAVPSLDGKDALVLHPEIQELNSRLSCATMPPSRFVSPFNPTVRHALVQLVVDFAHGFPKAGGIALDCHLSYGEVLGYSEAARLAFIRERQIDPIDIVLGGEEESEQYAREWYFWKRDQITSLIGELSNAYKSVHPDGLVYCTGRANFYRQKLGIRNLSCADWLNWVVEGYVDGVLLEEDWSDKANEVLYRAAIALVQKTDVRDRLTRQKKGIPLLPVVTANEWSEAEKVRRERDILVAQTIPPMIVYKVTNARSLEIVKEAVHLQ